VQFSTETSQSWRSNVVDTARGLAKPGGAGAQNKIIFALKLCESASLKDAAPMGRRKRNTVFSFSTINFFGGPPLPATTAV
jgi:hypothetical protein